MARAARGTAENRVRVSAGTGAGGDPAVQRRTDAAAVVVIRPRFSRTAADAVHAQRVRVALRNRTHALQGATAENGSGGLPANWRRRQRRPSPRDF